MNYEIESKDAFKVVGYEAICKSGMQSNEISALWGEHYRKGRSQFVMGLHGVCYEHDNVTGDYKYMIADVVRPNANYPSEVKIMEIPAGDWAVFPINGPLSDSIEKVTTYIWKDWLPNSTEWEHAGNMSMEYYPNGACNNPDSYSEIWIPVKKK